MYLYLSYSHITQICIYILIHQAATDRIDEYAEEIDVDLDKSLAELNMERDEIQVKLDKYRYTEGRNLYL